MKFKTAARSTGKAPGTRMSVAAAMAALEKAGSAQTRKTYARHGAPEPMFGVSFATLKTLVKKIRVDHELALELWKTGNFDARLLAVKVADPARMTPAELDRWAGGLTPRLCHSYVAQLASEGPHARDRADAWLASDKLVQRCSGWMLVSAMAMTSKTTESAWFKDHLKTIQKTIHTVPNEERESMNYALIAIGCRDAALQKLALAAAAKIGPVDVDHGDTACKTPDAAAYITKSWAHSESKGFASPAVQEQSREPMRTRC
ncbi:MAG: DNA alkylation repair protein [Planctomycetes bacterium]|nr:DNA alkylation repair protein [Planctomycetota bacterium]